MIADIAAFTPPFRLRHYGFEDIDAAIDIHFH